MSSRFWVRGSLSFRAKSLTDLWPRLAAAAGAVGAAVGAGATRWESDPGLAGSTMISIFIGRSIVGEIRDGTERSERFNCDQLSVEHSGAWHSIKSKQSKRYS